MSYIILDLDNCISDDAWRVKRIRWDTEDLIERYHYYHMGCGLDRARNISLTVGVHSTIISTSRPEAFAQVTMRWLQLHGVKPIELLMRKDDDHRPASIIKKEHYYHIVDVIGFPCEELHCVYDDSPTVIAMYDKIGVPVKQICINDPKQYERHKDHG